MNEAAILMKSFLLLTLAFGLSATTTQARIGYTLNQCVKEYGPYKMRQSWIGTVYDFQVNGERLAVVIQNDLVSSIQYNKPTGVQFDVNEMDDLLDKNKGNSVWGSPTPNLGDGTDHRWLTTSGPELVATNAIGFFSALLPRQKRTYPLFLSRSSKKMHLPRKAELNTTSKNFLDRTRQLTVAAPSFRKPLPTFTIWSQKLP